jgi:hypothetical protein
MQGDLNAIDKMTSKDDLANIKNILKITRQMTSYLDRKKLLAEMITIISESECIVFSSDRSKKFIDHEKPVFKLKINIPKAIEIHSDDLRFNPDRHNTEQEVVDFRMSVIHKEIVHPFGEIMRSALKNVDQNLLRDIPDAIELAKFIVSSIFQVKLETSKGDFPIVYVEYTL